MDLHLPPRTPAGDDVRARVLARVLDGLDQVPADVPARRRWLPAAAAVAGVLVVGGAVLVAGRSSTPSAVPAAQSPQVPTTGDSTKDGFLDRCAAALVASGRSADYPAPSTWTDSSFVYGGGQFVGAVNAAFFCSGTPTTVYVSATVGAPVGSAQVVPVSPSWAGVLNPDGATILASSGDVGTSDTTGRADFVALPPTGPAVTVTAVERDGSTSRATVPGDPAPVVVVDHPTPAQDRTSPDGVLLGDCLASVTGRSAPDPAAFRALPRITLGDDTVVVPTVAHGAAALCVAHGSYRELAALSSTSPTPRGEIVLQLTTALTMESPGYAVVLGVDPRATRLEVTGPSRPLTCRVADGVGLCATAGSGSRGTYTAYDAAGAVVAGPVSLG